MTTSQSNRPCFPFLGAIASFLFSILLVLIIVQLSDDIHEADVINDALRNGTCKLSGCHAQTEICGTRICYRYIMEMILQSHPFMSIISAPVTVTSYSKDENICNKDGTLLISNMVTCYYNQLRPSATLSLEPIPRIERDIFSYVFIWVALLFSLLFTGIFAFTFIKAVREERLTEEKLLPST